jgi:hypothetical protein
VNQSVGLKLRPGTVQSGPQSGSNLIDASSDHETDCLGVSQSFRVVGGHRSSANTYTTVADGVGIDEEKLIMRPTWRQLCRTLHTGSPCIRCNRAISADDIAGPRCMDNDSLTTRGDQLLAIIQRRIKGTRRRHMPSSSMTNRRRRSRRRTRESLGSACNSHWRKPSKY